jgi:pimeloyl-ACP methyl ester carboxylesterase
VRIYAQEHPEDVVGMVFVDASHPTMETEKNEMSSGQFKLWEFFARCGFFRLVGKQAWEAQVPSMARISDYPYPILLAPQYFETGRLESLVTMESKKQAEETGPFGDVPLVIITHEIPDLFTSLPEGEMEEAEEMWQTGQKDLTNLSANTQFLIAEGSGHNIPIENPGIINDIVRSMIDEYR